MEVNHGYLVHHGIKGMKWGVRRYQNEDGTLTEAGKKRYYNMSDDQLRKTLQKQIRNKKKEQYGWSNQWGANTAIGKNSKAALAKFNSDRKKYEKSDEYKKALEKSRKLDDALERGKIGVDEYDKEYSKVDKKINRPEFDSGTTYTSKGREYSSAFLKSYGNDINVAYIKDLGYDEATAKEFANRILNAKKKTVG